jgi:hypothetical protein
MAHRSGFAGCTSPSAIPGDIVTEDAPGETPRPGKIDTTRWRPGSEDAVSGPGEVDAMCGIGFKQ